MEVDIIAIYLKGKYTGLIYKPIQGNCDIYFY